MAEKVETILRRGVFNTRPKDYYDVYILATTQKYDKKLFKEAFVATAKHRETIEQIADTEMILQNLSESKELKAMWDKYNINIDCLENLVSLCPNCHKAFHYGTEDVKVQMIENLYNKIRHKYAAIGFNITLDEIKRLYGIVKP